VASTLVCLAEQQRQQLGPVLGRPDLSAARAIFA